MRVFVTGASGWIGSAVVPELIGAGHQVVGLARSDASAAALTAAGAEVHRGTLDDLDILRERGRRVGWRDPPRVQARHRLLRGLPGRRRRGPARRRDVRRGARGFRSAVRHRLRDARAGTGAGGDRTGRARSRPGAGAGGAPGRLATAQLTLSLAYRGVRSSVVRLPPTVHGDGDNGFMATLVGIARDKGVSGYIGDGSNRWPAVHRLDAAHLFRLALEQAPAGIDAARASPTRACRSATSPR